MASSGETKREWVLKKETELRAEVGVDETMTVTLLEGTAEIFGIELALNRPYTFSDENVAIFTWYGCTVETSPSTLDNVYCSDSTPMVEYVNTHGQLEARRDAAMANKEPGPRVLILGLADSGKSTTARILTAYAARVDRSPIYVDLDVGECSTGGIPGCIAAVPVEKSLLNVNEGFVSDTPLVQFFGQTNPKNNVKLYQELVSNMATKIKARLERDSSAQSSGIIINTNENVDGMGQDTINHIISAFNVDVVLVMGHDRLHARLVKEQPCGVSVMKLHKSGGVVARDSTMRGRARKARIEEYFYGPKSAQGTGLALAPKIYEFPLSKLTILRAGGSSLSAAMVPLGSDMFENQDLKLSNVRPSSDLLHSIVSVMHKPPIDGDASGADTSGSGAGAGAGAPGDVLKANVAGFLIIKGVDVEHDKLSVLSPCPASLESLPSNILMVGNVTWVE